MPIINETSSFEHVTYIDNGNVEVTNTPHVIVDSMPDITVPPITISNVMVTTPPGQPLPISGVILNTVSVDSELIIDQTLPVSGVMSIRGIEPMTGIGPFGDFTGLPVFIVDEFPVGVYAGNGASSMSAEQSLTVVGPYGNPVPVTGVVSVAGLGAGTLNVTAPPGVPMPVTGVMSIAGQSGGGGISVVTPAGQPLPVSGVILNTVSTTATISGPVVVASGANVNIAGGEVNVGHFSDSVMIISETLPVTGVVSVSSVVQAQINTYKTNVSIWSSVTLTHDAASTTSSAINLTTARQISLNIKLVNGGTGPSVAAQVQILVSNDGSNYYNYGGAIVGGLTASATYSWGGMTFPDGVQYIQLVAGSNTAQNVTVSADISYVRNM